MVWVFVETFRCVNSCEQQTIAEHFSSSLAECWQDLFARIFSRVKAEYIQHRVTIWVTWLCKRLAYYHTQVCSVISAALLWPDPNNDILYRTIVLHCYLYTAPSTLHPKRLLQASVSATALDSTASTNCSHWKPCDVWIGCARGRCLWMFFFFWLLQHWQGSSFRFYRELHVKHVNLTLC